MYTVTVTAEFSVTGNFFCFILMYHCATLCGRPYCWGWIVSADALLRLWFYLLHPAILPRWPCSVQKDVKCRNGFTSQSEEKLSVFHLNANWKMTLASSLSFLMETCKNSSKTLINRRSACLWYKVFKRKDTSRFKAFPTCAFEWNNKM